MSDAFELDPRQREIRELLKLIGPEPATYFVDACRIMAGAAGVATQTHLAAHLLREIEGRMHEVFEPMLSEGAAKQVAHAKAEDKGIHRAKILGAAEMLGLDEPTREQWIEYGPRLFAFAHRVSLAGPRDVAEFRDHFAKGQGVLVAVLRRFRTVYLDARPLLVELADVTAPTAQDVTTLRNRVPHSTVALAEFFSLATLGWFQLLRRAGYFENPPPLVPDEEGRVAYLEWPAARFLVRAAAVEEFQEEVVEILIALETDNPEARDATVDAALAMPVPLAARLASRVAEYIGEMPGWWVPRHSEELVLYLVGGGESDAALRVVRPLLAQAPGAADWRMRHAFTDLVPKLFPSAGLEALALLCELLAEELSAEGRHDANDYSTIWRDSIVGGHDMQRRDLLVTALDSAGASLVASGTATLRDVVSIVSRDRRSIFGRLALHLTARYPEPELAAEWLGNEDVFRSHSYDREYAELAQASFPALSTKIKARVFGWIERGPTWRPSDLAEDDRPEYDDLWRLRQLRRLPELPADWEPRYGELVAQYGEPEDPLTRQRYAVWSGTQSPKSKADLLKLGDEELLDFIEAWEPDGEWSGSSIEGLGYELREAAVEAPQRFSHLLTRLADGKPTYARQVVYGLQQAARDEAAMDWSTVLQFARTVIRFPGQLEGRDAAEDNLDPGLEWARLEIARLVGTGLSQRLIPLKLARDVWDVLVVLAEDEDPTVDTEDSQEAEGTEPELLSLNSVRGTAIEAVMQFAWWQRPAAGEAADDRDGKLPPFVREVLERHLDPEHERTRTVQSLFGRHFNQLYSLDPVWATDHVQAIFPLAPGENGRHASAWRSFIESNRFWPTSFKVLAPEYRRAVEALADERLEDEEVSLLDSTGALLGHLLGAYLNDLIELSDNSILGVFFATAPLRLRRAFLEMIGTDLSGDHEVSEQVQEKLQRLWEWRSEKVFAAGNVSELAGFGWWFGSGKLLPAWSVEQLLRVLNAGGGVSFDYVVTQRLEELSVTDLRSAVHICSALAEHAYSPDMVISGRDQFRAVLAAGLSSGDDELIASARATISRLYAERHTDFNDLLE